MKREVKKHRHHLEAQGRNKTTVTARKRRPLEIAFPTLAVVILTAIAVLVVALGLQEWMQGNTLHRYKDNAVDFAIIGAGPAGLQWAALLLNITESTKQQEIPTVVVIEASEHAGCFFARYPRKRKLISINKQYHEGHSHDFGLRHDWHSLLGTEHMSSFSSFSRAYYPEADDLKYYLRRIASKLPVVYNERVYNISFSKDEGKHVLETTNRIWKAKHVIVATGYSARNFPESIDFGWGEPLQAKNFSKLKTYTYATFPDLDKNGEAPFCRGKKVGIVGAGNSAFETAEMLAGCASTVSMYLGARTPRFSSMSHYVGDVRMSNFGIIDRYQLKSLDSILDGLFFPEHVEKEADVLIFCGGFTTKQEGLIDAMNESTGSRFPILGPFYSDPRIENKWYAGANMHGGDYRKSAGGFIHGFRYLIRAQIRFILMKEYAIPWPVHAFTSIDETISFAQKRIQNSSGLYQMQDVLLDVIVPRPSGIYLYIEEVPKNHAAAVLELLFPNSKEVSTKIELGFAFANTSIWSFDYFFRSERAGQTPGLFLHPIVTHYFLSTQCSVHCSEDLHGLWTEPYQLGELRKSILLIQNTTSMSSFLRATKENDIKCH
eukprot:m.160913 g.160913  ORF g.160913 m.160913 type:complete len:604 (-) comp15178_c0_seq5:163-1974(-)